MTLSATTRMHTLYSKRSVGASSPTNLPAAWSSFSCAASHCKHDPARTVSRCRAGDFTPAPGTYQALSFSNLRNRSIVTVQHVCTVTQGVQAGKHIIVVLHVGAHEVVPVLNFYFSSPEHT